MICVFLGPTLSRDDALAELDATYLPPAGQGDVYAAARGGARAIGIVDGSFEQEPAIWHKEILWAMSRGVAVYGAASMGALRAVELAPFGMIGVGSVFEAYRRGALEDDDEVAVRHAPAEADFRASSEAMVDVRATLAAAEEEGIVGARSRATLERVAKELFYADRTYRAIAERAGACGVPAAETDRLLAWLPRGRVRRKRADALAMLRAMRIVLGVDEARPPREPSFVFEPTRAWVRATAT
jgi:hypothetical protein